MTIRNKSSSPDRLIRAASRSRRESKRTCISTTATWCACGRSKATTSRNGSVELKSGGAHLISSTSSGHSRKREDPVMLRFERAGEKKSNSASALN